jgi:hypothetical protein
MSDQSSPSAEPLDAGDDALPTLVSADADDGDNDAIPHLSIAFSRAEGVTDDVDMVIHILNNPSPDKPASKALLTGLAILALERQGYVAKAVERMFPSGAPTEKAATDHVILLMSQEANELAV